MALSPFTLSSSWASSVMGEVEEEGEKDRSPEKARGCGGRLVVSPEIVEVGEEESGQAQSARDVYVAVGKKDLGAVKWAVDNAGAGAGIRVLLIHIFPPVNYIPTPVGMLARSQLSPEQVNFYKTEASNRRRNLLQKYIDFCTDAKVTVDTVLVESNETAKSILELIRVLNITNLVMGAKHLPNSRRLRKGMAKGEYVLKNAPEFCEVTIVCDGKKVSYPREEPVSSSLMASSDKRAEIAQPQERKFFDCVCFSGKFS